MDFDLTPDEQKFKDEATAWLRANKPELTDGDENAGRAWIDQRRAWQKKMFKAGYVGLNWPVEYGGKGADLMQQLLFSEALIETGAPSPVNVLALGMLGPTLIAQGTEEQKARYLPKMLNADEIWCQGFSEPNAGSDLSALRTRAERKGDHYLVNGQKVWTTLAHVSKYCMCLTREFAADNPRDGLTYLIIDMEAKGVEARPLVQITGDPEFNELFFTDVEVPIENVVGEPGKGWAGAMTTLLHERGTLGMSLANQATITARALIEHARRLGRGGEPLVRQKIAQHVTEARALHLNGQRAVTGVMKTGMPGPEGSLMKLFWSELNQRMQETAVDLEGMYGELEGNGPWQYGFLRSKGNTIEAGSSEVLRNIIAERVLGLPRSR
ncbi:MAG TPA: acyl-CoA dehydrogenase family protein [Candidatus Dormibacteraeota bacterium]|nr:acyl-CoA dehydrogenase family protein [Candidatus Dormibacteraeota bacterium]